MSADSIKSLKKLVRAFDGCSPAALRVLAMRGSVPARKVISETLRAAAPTDSIHSMSYWSLVRGFAVEEDVVIHAGSWFDGSPAPLERFVIAQLARYFKPKCVVEVGTFRGTTTRLLIDNIPLDAKLYTIDLPDEIRVAADGPFTDQHLIRQRVLAAEVRRHARAGNVVQVFGNSFEESTWQRIPSNIDFAFIDASHSYEAVKNDTERVRQKLAANGVIMWHDYSEGETPERGVGRYIRQEMKKHDDIFICRETDLAVRISTTSLLEAEERVASFFPDNDFGRKCPQGAVPWLRLRDSIE